MSQTESPSERVKRAAGALQSDEPQLNELWAAMRLARKHVVDLAPVIEVLVQNGPRLNLDHDQRVVLYELLAQDTAVVGQTVDKDASPIPEWGPLPETEDPTMQAVMESARQAVDSQLRFRNRVLDDKNRYFAFSPAWEVEGLLPLVFGPDDPATVIAEHLRTLFDVRRLTDEPAGVYLQAASVTENVSAALTHLIGIALRAADLSVPEKSVLSFMEDLRRDCWKLTGADRAAQLLIVIGASLQANQILFVAFLNTLIGHLVDFTAATEDPQRDASEALYRTAIQLLFTFSTPETEGTTPRLLIEAPESRTLPTHLSQIVETFDGLVEQLAAREEGRPFLPPQLLPHLLQLHGVFEYLHEEDTELFLEHIRFGVQYRSDALRGYAQYELSGGYLLQDVLATHRLDATREDDLTYQLGQVWLEYTDPDGSVLTYLPLWRGYREYSTPDTEKRRASEFRALVRSAIAEGFPRLAEALAAFFVFSQSLRYQGRLEPWEVVSEIIASVSRVAEPRHLPAALTFAHEMASHHGERLLLLRIPDRAPRTYDYASIAGNLPGIGFAHREIVIKEVLELIGAGRRSILTGEGFDLLVDAHYKLSKLHRELIFGVLGNWGGIALDFAKVFEVELTSALGAIIRDPAYRQFKASRAKGRSPPVRPTLGSFLHLLREYAQLPIPLQLQLDSASELHGNPQLLTRLEKIINERRNPAAHAAGYGPRKLQELLDLLYGHQVLPEFIVPQASGKEWNTVVLIGYGTRSAPAHGHILRLENITPQGLRNRVWRWLHAPTRLYKRRSYSFGPPLRRLTSRAASLVLTNSAFQVLTQGECEPCRNRRLRGTMRNRGRSSTERHVCGGIRSRPGRASAGEGFVRPWVSSPARSFYALGPGYGISHNLCPQVPVRTWRPHRGRGLQAGHPVVAVSPAMSWPANSRSNVT